MFGKKFYNGAIRKYVIYFGTLFNDIEFDRENDGVVVQEVRVPISYGPREKYLNRIQQDPNLEKQVEVNLPRMSFEMTSFNYAPERRLGTTQKLYQCITGDAQRMASVYTPTPFDIGFQLAIFVRNAEDGVRILEQILPFFTPEFTATLKLLDDMPDIKTDVPLIFNSLSTEDTYEGSYENRRTLIHTLDFTLKGYLFGPVTNQAGIIKTANTQLFVDTNAEGVWDFNNDQVHAEIVVTPGVDANGNPTSNSANAVDANTVAPGDDFDYIVTHTE